MKLIGALIRARRQELGMSGTHVAVRAGITLSRLSQIEHSHVRPYTRTLEKICKVLRLDPDWLCPIEKSCANCQTSPACTSPRKTSDISRGRL